jgi:hypothetical protein
MAWLLVNRELVALHPFWNGSNKHRTRTVKDRNDSNARYMYAFSFLSFTGVPFM